MTKTKIATVALLALLGLGLVVLVFAVGRRVVEKVLERGAEPAAATSLEATSAPGESAVEAHPGFLYGRITTVDGANYEGRLRFGLDEEAFWGDYFNGYKDENRWAVQVSPEQLMERRPREIFGVEVGVREREINLRRPFMSRFGDIAHIEASGRDLQVTLKSGTLVHLDRFSADDFADGLRVWDNERGTVDLGERQIRTIELLSSAWLGAAADRLHGTVRTPSGDFTGFVQWGRQLCLGSDQLEGRTADGDLGLRFDTIRAIERSSADSALVTLKGGREILLSGDGPVGPGNRGVYVDDQRYGRVLISWEAFERVDFSDGGNGPAYGDFPPGSPLTGQVTTRTGQRLAGRLVYDLDESEITETLDAPSQGVDYTILFGLIASVVPRSPDERAEHARVTLHSGEQLLLERAGDLGAANAGMLIFVDGQERPEYVRWADVEQVDFDPPPAMYPPF